MRNLPITDLACRLLGRMSPGADSLRVSRAYSVDDLRALAKRRLPRVCFDFVEGGAEAETTLRANIRAFEQLTFRPRPLVDVGDRRQEVTVFGTRLASPVILGPIGLPRIVSRHAEVDAARAAGAAGTVLTVGTGSSTSLEEIAAAATGPLWFQLYLWKDRSVYEGLVKRAQRLGYQALVVTVDVPVSSKRERDLRNGFTLPLQLSLLDRLEAARHPRWVLDYLTGPPITFANLTGLDAGAKVAALSEYVNRELNNPHATYEDLRRLRTLWTGPLLVKGVLTAAAARQAVEHGADGVIVSNHGGRQLDGAPATIDVLGEIVSEVGDRAEVLLDSGIRRGSDVVKALALGAKATLVGRPYLWGLAAGGQAGVERALEILREEIDICLTLLGRRSLAELDQAVVTRRPAT
jgi:isopentenyl diphosphate isomerase/L-lactate dehydrogenase-like FMN-dependent dehydrogenase